MPLRARRHPLFAATAAMYAGGVAAAALTGVSSMMAGSTVLVGTAAWAYGARVAAAVLVACHAASAAVMVGAGHTEVVGTPPAVILLPVVASEVVVLVGMAHLRRLELAGTAAAAELRRRNAALADALAEVKELRGMLPICAWCKAVRDVDGMWDRLEGYLARHSRAVLTHGICPACAAALRDDPPPP